jgi:AraC-like DNA-binding protein
MDQNFFENLNFKPFFADFFDNAPDLYAFAKDADLRFTMMNKALLKRIGIRTESEILGKNDFDFFERNLAELFREEDREVIESKTPALNRTWSVPSGKGGLDWYISSKYPLSNYSGDVIGYIGVMRGITEAGSILEPYSEMTAAINFIQNNFYKQIEIPLLAELVHLSVSQFERKFKQLLKMTPLKFINKVRIDNACEMLIRTNDTLSSIAIDCGFYDHSYFTKIFKKQMNMAPAAYRKEYLQKENRRG